jgi:ABC-type bacteriocin/lantibiotic exporter with double-glycine peptidase domain
MSDIGIRRVAQRDWHAGDCGIACVAMVSGKTYERAMAAFRRLDGKSATNMFHTRHADLARMLEDLGFKSRRLRFARWRKLSCLAIVPVHRRSGGFWTGWCSTLQVKKQFSIRSLVRPGVSETSEGSRRGATSCR